MFHRDFQWAEGTGFNVTYCRVMINVIQQHISLGISFETVFLWEMGTAGIDV